MSEPGPAKQKRHLSHCFQLLNVSIPNYAQPSKPQEHQPLNFPVWLLFQRRCPASLCLAADSWRHVATATACREEEAWPLQPGQSSAWLGGRSTAKCHRMAVGKWCAEVEMAALSAVCTLHTYPTVLWETVFGQVTEHRVVSQVPTKRSRFCQYGTERQCFPEGGAGQKKMFSFLGTPPKKN